MTKERKLAIEMWTNIRDRIATFDHEMGQVAIIKYKDEFCKLHSLHWALNCWFCQYIKGRYRYTAGCLMCPLRSCVHGCYSYALDETMDKDERVEACNNIIKALGGKA